MIQRRTNPPKPMPDENAWPPASLQYVRRDARGDALGDLTH